MRSKLRMPEIASEPLCYCFPRFENTSLESAWDPTEEQKRVRLLKLLIHWGKIFTGLGAVEISENNQNQFFSLPSHPTPSVSQEIELFSLVSARMGAGFLSLSWSVHFYGKQIFRAKGLFALICYSLLLEPGDLFSAYLKSQFAFQAVSMSY